MNEQPLTRREARDLERMREVQSSQERYVLPDSNLHSTALEPKTLVVDAVPDITNMVMALPETGAIITTGAIDLPWLKTETGQSQVVQEASEADKAIADTTVDTNSIGITPIPARNHERTRRRASVFPTRLRKGWGVVHLVMVSGFLLFALLCGLLAAFFLGIITF